MMDGWRNFYESSSEPLDSEEFLVIYLDATDPESVEQVLGESGYTHSDASNILGVKLGEYAFSECDLGKENIVDSIIVYHSLPRCWAIIDQSEEGLTRKKSLIESWFMIPSGLIIDFGLDLLDELNEEARISYP
jgi:hypothetical protein